MSDPAERRMNSDEFIAWAMAQPEGRRYELDAGEIVAMAPERVRHALMKFQIARRLAEAIEAKGLPCTVFPDGMAFEIDRETIYEPDAMVRCGPALDGDALKLHDPVIVVEVLSPSTSGVDTGAKLASYFRVASVMHYLLVRPKDARIIHHRRGGDGDILTRIHVGGPLTLDPPGITLALAPHQVGS